MVCDIQFVHGWFCCGSTKVVLVVSRHINSIGLYMQFACPTRLLSLYFQIAFALIHMFALLIISIGCKYSWSVPFYWLVKQWTYSIYKVQIQPLYSPHGWVAVWWGLQHSTLFGGRPSCISVTRQRLKCFFYATTVSGIPGNPIYIIHTKIIHLYYTFPSRVICISCLALAWRRPFWKMAVSRLMLQISEFHL